MIRIMLNEMVILYLHAMLTNLGLNILYEIVHDHIEGLINTIAILNCVSNKVPWAQIP